MPTAEYTLPGHPLRQSYLRKASQCMLSAWYSSGTEWTTPALDFGTLAHEVFAEILASCAGFVKVNEEYVRTSGSVGEEQIPTQEAIEIMHEVVERSNIVLPLDRDYGMEQLRWQVISFCNHKWPTGVDNGPQVFAIEKRMFLEVPCPDGITRIVTGQPDAMVTDPGREPGMVFLDWKSGMAKPKEPQDGDLTKEDGKKYLSTQGLFQLNTYGAMLLADWPGLHYVILREYHTRWNKMREAKLYREDLEHVMRELGNLLMKVDKALEEGEGSELLRASPGAHCHYCPGKYKCPVPYDQRGEGSIVDEDMALAYEIKWMRADAVKADADKALKAWIEAGGRTPPLEDGSIINWQPTPKSRRFGNFHP
jgi:hypothetical protein